jgi:DNA-binding FadR family transcriptional regulator
MKKYSGGHNLTHQACNQLGSDIVHGKYDQEKRLPTEAVLAEQYDISRSVMREAVKMLTAKGLIISRPRQGISLLPNSYWNMFDTDVLSWTLSSRPSLGLLKEFTQLRLAIEPEAAKLASGNKNKEVIEQIELAYCGMEKAGSSEGAFLNSDIEFHKGILVASNNRFFIQLQGFIETALRVSIHHTNNLKRDSVKSSSVSYAATLADHKAVLDAIKKGNAKKAALGMQAILLEAIQLIDEAISR